MRIFVDSLKRLYACRQIDIAAVERQLKNMKITEEEYRYIVDTGSTSSDIRKEDYNV